MKTNLTIDQIEAREKVWNAAQENKPVTLTAAEVNHLWASILSTGRELSDLRDRVQEALKGLGNS